MNGKQLKNSILQWAIQGKLVPQDPNDEPASVLLERIREEKARLVKEKKIKKDKNESIIYRGDDNSHYEKFLASGEVKCIDEEIPFEIPQSWCWVRLNELGLYRKGPFGSSLTKDMFVPYSESAVKVYEQKNAIQKDYRLGHYYISDAKFNQMQSFVTNPGDIIVSCAGTIGETYQLPDDAPIGIINQALMRVCLYDKRISEYWQLSFDFILLVNSEMKGAGSAIKNIPPFEVLKSLLVPIPPIAEQNRILSQYRILQNKIRTFETLNSNLERLNSTIFDKLKKSVLQEAIQGKLVSQDPNDEPASVLLQRIKAEKAKLFKEGKLKKKDLVDSVIFKGEDNKYYEKIGSEVACIDDEIPFEIPTSWVWARLEQLCTYIQRGKSPKYSEIKKYPVVAQKCNQWSGFSLDKALFLDPATIGSYGEERFLQDGDLLWNSTGLGTLGRMAIYDSSKNEYGLAVADSHVTVIRAIPFMVSSEYLFKYFSSHTVQSVIEDKSEGSTKQKELATSTVKSYIVPLPPYEEQLRIVAAANNVIASIMRG